jgi:hypothetical protein
MRLSHLKWWREGDEAFPLKMIEGGDEAVALSMVEGM